MYYNLTGLILALAVALHLWMIITILWQKTASILRPFSIYLNLLLVFIEICAILTLQNISIPCRLTVTKIQFVAEIFIPPLLVYLAQTYWSGKKVPPLNFRSIFFFCVSAILGSLAFFNLIITSWEAGVPHYTAYNWVVIVYFIATFGFLVYEFLKRYSIEKRQPEIEKIHFILTTLLPVALLAFCCLKLLPMWGITHPAILLFYPVFSICLLLLNIKLQIIELNRVVSGALLYFMISILFVLLASAFFPADQPQFFLFAIPVLLGMVFIFQVLEAFAHWQIQDSNQEREYDLESDLEILISETEKYIDNQALAQFIGDLALKVLHGTKCAVITSRFDIKPYQTSYVNGFLREQIETLVSSTNSPFLETLEFNRVILNKFDLSPHSFLYQMMEKYRIYLAIPMISKNILVGFILIGGDRKTMKISGRDLRFAKFLAIKAANSFQNILEIQKAVQSQKMADLGLVASQLAHDFQSFISLVKLDTSEGSPLRQHANYMEKLVKDLMNYARPRDLRLNLTNINHLIDMTLDLIKIPAGILLERHYSESVPSINLDEDQMRRVFLNLFENSLNAMKNGKGRLKITTRPLRPLSNLRRNTWLYIEILDDGVGIPEEFLEHIFDPFFTTRKNQGGNGMGLAIVRQIITRHRGFIDVTSKLGKGTIFNIRLPYLR